VEEGGVEIKHEPVDLHSIIERAVESVNLTVSSRKGQLESRLEADRHTVLGDDLHLYNIVTNLLDNACKYSSDAPQIRIFTEKHNGHIILRVSDRGIGIADEDRKHVFDRYFRVSTGDRHDVKGFGLGLSYVKLVVDALDGDISLNSALGKGTEVVIKLPLHNSHG
jgi:two-component system phosphate regulon sensor histidine kinase PhoR